MGAWYIGKPDVPPKYTIRLRPAEEGGFVVSCDEVPGAITEGNNIQEALEMMGEAMALMLDEEDMRG